MSTAKGVVEKIQTTDYQGKAMYNLTVSGERYGFGSNKPKCSEGDTVTFEYEQKGAYKNGNSKTVEVVAHATSQPYASAINGPAGVDYRGKTTATQTTISKQAALNSAIAFVNGLVNLEAVPGITKTMKAEERYDIMEALVYTKTKEFYKQSTGDAFPEDVEEVVEQVTQKSAAGGWQ